MTKIDTEHLQQQLLNLFRDELALEIDNASQELFADGLLDSLSFVRLLSELEGRYGVEVPLHDMEAETFGTIEKIAAYVQAGSAA
ncbi:MAG: phosphopantetheine-binding protein [Gemmatimonadota bacterium]|nr:phosphopantetheine-binding protein [Gemmatimonadota bacterium]